MLTEKRNYFYNDGEGWFCRRCVQEIDCLPPPISNSRERAVKDPDIADPRLARWMDKTRRTLICPRCGVTELIDIY